MGTSGSGQAVTRVNAEQASGRKARRSAHPTTHQIRAYHQPQDRQGAQARNSPDTARPGRRGDRVAAQRNGGFGSFSAIVRRPTDGSLSPDSFRARRMLLTAESGQFRTRKAGWRRGIQMAAQALTATAKVTAPYNLFATGQTHGLLFIHGLAVHSVSDGQPDDRSPPASPES